MAQVAAAEKIYIGHLQKTYMKIKEGFKLRTLLKEHIVTPEGSRRIDCTNMFALNQTAAYLWEKVQGQEFDEPLLTRLLTEEYDVAEDVASADVQKLVQSWRDAGLVED